FSEMRSRRDPALEEGCLILADLFGAGHWYDHGDVHQAIAYLHDAEVSIVIDVHLAHIGHALDLPVVRDQGNASRPDATSSHQTESSPDHRAKAVGPDDETGVENPGRAVWRDCGHPADT